MEQASNILVWFPKK